MCWYRAERSAPNRPRGDQREEALDQVEPRAIGRYEVQVPARTGGQPGLELRVLVGRVVVDDQVDVEVGRHRRFDRAQEAEELLMALPRLALRSRCCRLADLLGT